MSRGPARTPPPSLLENPPHTWCARPPARAGPPRDS